MINRAIAFSFILLANIILLAHAVIPHYHHKTEICITGFHSQEDRESHKHRSDENNNKHNGDSNSEYCVLKQVGKSGVSEHLTPE